MSELLTPQNPRWNKFAEFANKFYNPEDCKFAESGPGTWRCGHSTEKPFTRAILKKMGNVHIDATLRFFEKRGGYCDCMVLLDIKLESKH